MLSRTAVSVKQGQAEKLRQRGLLNVVEFRETRYGFHMPQPNHSIIMFLPLRMNQWFQAAVHAMAMGDATRGADEFCHRWSWKSQAMTFCKGREKEVEASPMSTEDLDRVVDLFKNACVKWVSTLIHKAFSVASGAPVACGVRVCVCVCVSHSVSRSTFESRLAGGVRLVIPTVRNEATV